MSPGKAGGRSASNATARRFYVAWHYKHRAALGDAQATLASLAAKEGITGRFAEHVWYGGQQAEHELSRARHGRRLEEAAGADDGRRRRRLQKARAECDALSKALTTWPSWFFARGDLAAGGAGDESPLVFDDTTLNAEPTRAYTYPIGPRAGRGRGPAPAPGPGEGLPDVREPQPERQA